MPDVRSRLLTAALLVAAVTVFAFAVAGWRGSDADRSASAGASPAPATTSTTSPPTTTAAPPTTTTTSAPPPPARIELSTLDVAPDGADRYAAAVSPDDDGDGPGRLEVFAPTTNTGDGMRAIYWETARPATVDQRACATFTGTNDSLQQGFALRVHRAGEGWRLITVTKNILYGAYWQFNVHLWDTTAGVPFEPTGFVTVQDLFFVPIAPYPWHACARAVGDQVDVKVWREGPEPAWGDPQHGGRVALPPGWAEPGQTGWFAGHVPAGRTAHFEDLEAGPAIGGIDGVSE